MTKAQFFAHVRALYIMGNLTDSDSPDRQEWTHPSMASTVCARLDTMLADMTDAGAITQDERQSFYDNM